MPELGVAQSLPFGEILDAADRLTAAEQEALVAILRRRLAERGRKRIAADIAESRGIRLEREVVVWRRG